MELYNQTEKILTRQEPQVILGQALSIWNMIFDFVNLCQYAFSVFHNNSTFTLNDYVVFIGANLN